MGKKSKAPSYQAASFDTGGLFGSSTTDKNGTTFRPVGWQSETMTTVGNSIPTTFNNMLSGDFSNDANYQAYRNNLNRQLSQSFDANVLGQLANRGLMRSSGLQSATNSFADTLANNEMNLYNNYYDRQKNNLSALMDLSNNIYNQIMGVNQGSQSQANALNGYNLNKYKLDQANNNNSLWGSLANTAGNAAGNIASSAMLASTLAASDINVKKNIKKIGKKNGYNWYEFEYKDGLGLPKGKQEGVISQEVEKVNPDAVVVINGIKHVDYNKLGVVK